MRAWARTHSFSLARLGRSKRSTSPVLSTTLVRRSVLANVSPTSAKHVPGAGSAR